MTTTSPTRLTKAPYVAVTGASGFLGRYVVHAFTAAGCHVLALTRRDRPEAPWPHDAMEPLEQITVRLHDLSTASWQNLFHDHDVDMVCHLAGGSSVPHSVEAPLSSLQNTIAPSLTLLEAVRQYSPTTCVLFTSSAAVYGNPDALPVHEASHCRPLSPYGLAKLTVEMYLKLYHDLYGIRGASLRPFSAYGPGQRKQIIWDLLQRLSTNPAELTLLGDSSQSRDFIHAEDVARAFVHVARTAPLIGETYNVAMGQEVTTRVLADKLCTAFGAQPNLRFTGITRAGEPQRWVADITALTALGFTPTITLANGLARTVAWWRSLSKSERVEYDSEP